MTQQTSASQDNKTRKIAYWITTAIVAFIIGAGGVVDILRPPEIMESMAHLGYPDYFPIMLGIWKVLGAVVILLPKLPRLKEWAYAGIVIDLIAAAVSHAAVGDPASNIAVPLVFLGLTALSHYLRPSSRMLHTTS